MLTATTAGVRLAVRDPISTDEPADDERAWLRATASGDRTAYEALFKRYYARIHSFVFRMLGEAELADEVTADTLLAVWTDAHRFKGQSTLSTWIFGIAYRKCLQALRSRKRYTNRHESINHVEALTDETAGDDPPKQYADETRLARVSEAIDELSDVQRAVVRLTASGHSCAEIADILECPRNTVKTRMFHARNRLRDLLVAQDAQTADEVSHHE